jgi:omega-6 fatty acid desaturase (delta-12 desaturase)
MDAYVNICSPQPTDVRHWPRTLARYNQPSDARGLFEIAVTIVPLVGLWLLAWAMLDISYWIALPLALAAGAFVVRLFMIQHDCGHGSFFRHRFANVWIGRLASIVTMTPFGFWKRTHAVHHASSGNLDRRGMGDIDTLTVAEYRARSMWGRLRYRLYRHPLVMFGFGPTYLFLLQHRLPVGMMRGKGWRPWISTMTTNAAIAAAAGALIWLIGLKPFLMIHLPVAIMAASIGVWLFYVQHQFEGTTWAKEGSWNALDAALHGSSHYDLPAFLRWITANIGMHHLHHLSSRIPYYRLPRVLRDHPELREIGRLTLSQSLGCVRLVLWDDTQRRLVSFREARANA